MVHFPAATPEQVGVSSLWIEKFLDRLEQRGIMMHSVMMLRHGLVFAEGYYAPFRQQDKHRMYSISKSFVATAIGMLVDEGRLQLSDKVVSFFPDKVPADAHPYILDMTVRDLLRMATPYSRVTYEGDTEDWTKTFFTSKPDHPPGTVFNYDTSGSHVLTAIVETVAGMPLLDYLRDKGLGALGFSSDAWCVKAPEGTSWGGSGVICTTRDVALLGLLYRNGGILDGKRLLEHFGAAPFGWSQDTLRYLVTALLVAGDIKLKVSGREVTVAGQQAIDALKTNNAFKPIGVALRQDRPSVEVLARAAVRLTDLIGETVVPLEEDISKTAAKHLPRFQQEYAPLAEKLAALDLPGGDRVRSLSKQIGDLLFTDASDAPEHLGGEESTLYDGLKWAQAVTKALGHGLEDTIRALRLHQRVIERLPSTGIPGQLKQECADALEQITGRLGQDDFHQYAADLSTILTGLRSQVAVAAEKMEKAQQDRIAEGEQDLKRISEWAELTQEMQSNALNQLAGLAISVSHDLAGLERLVSHEFDLSGQLEELKQRITQDGRNRQKQRVDEQKKKDIQDGRTKASRSVHVPCSLTTTAQLDDLIRQLQMLRAELSYYEDFEVRLERD